MIIFFLSSLQTNAFYEYNWPSQQMPNKIFKCCTNKIVFDSDIKKWLLTWYIYDIQLCFPNVILIFPFACLQSHLGLGFAIQEGNSEGHEGIFIKTVTPGGPAMQVSKLTSLCRLGLQGMILYKLHVKWKHLVVLLNVCRDLMFRLGFFHKYTPCILTSACLFGAL